MECPVIALGPLEVRSGAGLDVRVAGAARQRPVDAAARRLAGARVPPHALAVGEPPSLGHGLGDFLAVSAVDVHVLNHN